MGRTIKYASLLYKTMKKTILITLLIIFFKPSFSQEEIKVLWLGNSYTFVNNLPEMVNELSFGTDKVVISESICPGGCTLFQHAESKTSLNAVREGCWDYVVLQEQSQLPSIDYYRHNAMRPAYQTLYDTIMLYNPEAKVVGYMTWGRRYGGQQCVNFGEGLYCSADFVDFNHMQDTMSVAYCENAYATNSYVSPVGDAWKEALSQDENLVLHSSDESHPSYEGSYLAAAVFHAVFWKESPIGTYYDSTYIDKSKAEFLQTIADSVFFNNLEKWNFSLVSDTINIDTTNIDSTYINNKKYNDNFEIINNSNNDSVIIKNNNNTYANVKIMNINGVIIDEKNIKEEETFHIKNSKGVYIIQISGQDSQNHFVHKILKL